MSDRFFLHSRRSSIFNLASRYSIVRSLIYFSLFIVSISLFADLKEGKKAYSRKDYTEALKQFQKYNDNNPSSGEAWMYMGYIYESRKDYSKSIQAFKKAVSLSLPKKDLINCYTKIILYYNYHREYGEVITYANRLLKIAPDLNHIQKMKIAAEERHSSGGRPSRPVVREESDEQESVASLEKKLRQDPNNKNLKWQLSLAYYNEKEFGKSESILSELVKEEPENIEYGYKYGALLVRIAKYDEALNILNRIESKIPPEREKLLYFTHLTQAAAFHKKRNFEEATKYYRKAYANKQTVLPLIGLTKIKWQVKDCENAIKTAEKALEFGEKTREIKMYIGLCKIQEGKKDEGYEILKEIATSIEKENPNLQNLPEVYNDGILKLARYYTNAGQYGKALRYFHSVEPDEEEEREYRFYLGKAYFYTGSPEKAIVLLEKIENSSNAYFLLAKCYARLGNVDKVMANVKKAAELNQSLWNSAEKEKEFKKFEDDDAFKKFLNTRAGTRTVDPPSAQLNHQDRNEVETD
ncbi:anaphase-promoting complex, cyclosome, subunit 3 [Leptospira fainei serovar Hurstbridge str. BUT 6]|uniref:Anaphase-promoting complex, cyclosome, subunit 3 n=1 Tax=Leptospira fainei serovar Hurstbridge str. BUT 6 TaxID=1193011 RepID=S3UXU7_9LEPT|nr:anaphase-promoting complex, cyclosome, subunit 3 [Leptospira fainei serovar Hurstbridge str. BUT 6]